MARTSAANQRLLMRVTKHQSIRNTLGILLCFVGCLTTVLRAEDITKSSEPLAPTKAEAADPSTTAVTVPVDAKTVTATDAEGPTPLNKAPGPADSSESTEKTIEKAQTKEAKAVKKAEAKEAKTEATTEAVADKAATPADAEEPPPLEAPDDSSERVGFGSSTSPLDKTPDPTPEPEEVKATEGSTTDQAKPQTDSPAPDTTEAATTPDSTPQIDKEKPASPGSSTPTQAPDKMAPTDDSSDRVGFDPDTTPPADKEPTPVPGALHNTGIPFVDDTVYFVAPRAYYRYFDSGNKDEDSSEAFAIGGSLGLKSGLFKNFASIRLTAHTSQKVMSSSDDQDDDDSAGLLKDGRSYSEITEANLNLHTEAADLRLGIQRIDVPYLNSHDTRMVPNTFRAYTIKSQNSGKLSGQFSYVDGMRDRTGSDYESLSEQAGADDNNDGAYLLALRYEFSDNANIGLVELNTPDTLNAFYVETNAVLPFFDLIDLDLGIQFSDQRTVGDEQLGHYSTQQYGFKLRAKYEKLVSTFVFTHTGSDNGIETPWGGSPSYNSMMISDFDRAGEKAVGGSMSYRFSGKATEGFVSSVRWTYGNTPDSGDNASSDQYELNWNFDFYPKEVPNLWFRLRFARNYQVDSDYEDARDIRFIVNYVKTF